MYRMAVIFYIRELYKMAPNKKILKDKIEILDAEIKQLKYKLNAMEWERNKYLQFCDNDSKKITPHSST